MFCPTPEQKWSQLVNSGGYALACHICYKTITDDNVVIFQKECLTMLCEACRTSMTAARLPCPSASMLCRALNPDGTWKMRGVDGYFYDPCKNLYRITPEHMGELRNRITGEYWKRTTNLEFNCLRKESERFLTSDNRKNFPSNLSDCSPTQLYALAVLSIDAFPAFTVSPEAWISDLQDKWLEEMRAHFETGTPRPRDVTVDWLPPIPYESAPVDNPVEHPQPAPVDNPVVHRRNSAPLPRVDNVNNRFGEEHGAPGESLPPAYHFYKPRAQGAPVEPFSDPDSGNLTTEALCRAGVRHLTKYWSKFGGAPKIPAHFHLKGVGCGCRPTNIYDIGKNPNEWVREKACCAYWNARNSMLTARIKANAFRVNRAEDMLGMIRYGPR